MASTLACALCPETTPPPDAVIGHRPAGSGPGWPILAHLICAAEDGVRVVGEWTADDTEQLARAWGRSRTAAAMSGLPAPVSPCTCTRADAPPKSN